MTKMPSFDVYELDKMFYQSILLKKSSVVY